MGALQPMHLIIVLVIVLLIFGPGKLPELGRAIGDGMRELKRGTNGQSEAASGALAPVTAITSSLCSRCQAPLPISGRYCGECGNQIEAALRVHAAI